MSLPEAIRFRTISGEEHEVPINPACTVQDLIDTLKPTINIPNFKLIHEGKTLNPEVAVISLGIIDPNDFIIIKPIKAKKQDQSKTTSTPTIESIPTEPHSVHSEQPRRKRFGLPQRDGVKLLEKDPPDFDEKVNLLLEVGNFPREDVEKALRVAFYNLDRASLFLVSGTIPDVPRAGINSRPGVSKRSDDKNAEEDEQQQPFKISDTHIELIQELVHDTGVDYATVLQIAEACGYNKEQTLECLQSIDES